MFWDVGDIKGGERDCLLFSGEPRRASSHWHVIKVSSSAGLDPAEQPWCSVVLADMGGRQHWGL